MSTPTVPAVPTLPTQRRREALRQWLLESEPVFGGSPVDVLVDGSEYFEHWFDSVARVFRAKYGPRRVLHYGWRLMNIAPEGKVPNATGLVAMLRHAASHEVEVRVSASGHAWGFVAVPPPLWWRLRRSRGVQVLIDRSLRNVILSNHVKLSIFEAGTDVWAVLGSVDLAAPRYDRAHERIDPRRYATPRGPSHDLGVRIEGPAAIELQRRFAARWTAACSDEHRRRVRRVSGSTALTPMAESVVEPTPDPRVTGTVQIVETIPPSIGLAAPTNSFGRLLHRAIATAREYIYIEDQYFAPDLLDTPAGAQGLGPEFDVLPLLVDALRRGVRVIVLLPSRDPGRTGTVTELIDRRRDRAIWRLQSEGDATNLVTLQYNLPTHPVYIHSKLVICDDEFMLVGSANICRRGLLSDLELAVGIVNPLLVTATRQRLWAEHAGLHEGSPEAAGSWSQMLAAMTSSRRLAAYTVDREPAAYSRLDTWLIDTFIDPIQ
jgi:phosphatidylserine/phosphatidylglycerophosphate/cardiolipin synthase-like enzyme